MAAISFGESWRQVVDGVKTQTRRPVRSLERASRNPAGEIQSVVRVIQPRYSVGQVFEVVPVPGVEAVTKVADIEVTAIRRENARQISEADARAEGFPSAAEFIRTWNNPADVWVLEFRVLTTYPDAIAAAQI